MRKGHELAADVPSELSIERVGVPVSLEDRLNLAEAELAALGMR